MSDDRHVSDEVAKAVHRAGAVRADGLMARPNVKNVKIRAVLIKADGTQAPLGVVSATHKNPVKQWFWLKFHDARAVWRRWFPVKGKAP